MDNKYGIVLFSNVDDCVCYVCTAQSTHFTGSKYVLAVEILYRDNLASPYLMY
jgi:hypothetical protein